MRRDPNESSSGEEAFKGTRISVRHIGSLLRKRVKIEEIKEDYPRLTPAEIQFAQIYTDIKRPAGRPSKPIIVQTQLPGLNLLLDRIFRRGSYLV
jgi:uncharacterized protein (DUF433 family)